MMVVLEPLRALLAGAGCLSTGRAFRLGAADLAHQFGRAHGIEEAAEIGGVFGIGLGIHRDRGIGHHLLQHPDAAAGAQGQGDGIAGPRIELVAAAAWAAELEHGAEGVVLELLPSQLVRVELDGRHQVTAHLASPVGRNFVRVIVGDRVRVALMPNDPSRARIVEKL